MPPTWNANTVYKFIQILWEKGLDWDDKLDDKDKETWTKMTQDIHKLSSIQIQDSLEMEKVSYYAFVIH